MEAFSLLNYWKNNTSGLTFIPPSSDSSCRFSGEATTIVTSATETDDDDEDEGPFFDLEFAPPLEEEDSDCTDEIDSDFKFIDPEVYFNGKIVEEDEDDEEEIEHPSSSSTEQTCSVKAPAAQLSASILKSATKLRVLMLKMKKSKLGSEKSDINLSSESQQKSTVTVNLKVDEVPVISLFARDNSSRNTSSSSSTDSSTSSKKQNGNESCVLEETRFVMMQKYLKKVKPLYVRVSRRYGEKLRHSGSFTAEKKETPATKMVKSLSIPAGLKVVRKHLGKSRSSSSTTAAATESATTASGASVATVTESRRRDDSLLQQQDSIQSAILHCKRSFNSSRDKDPSVLPRSVSE